MDEQRVHTCVICGKDYQGDGEEHVCANPSTVAPQQTDHSTTVLDFGDFEITVRRK